MEIIDLVFISLTISYIFIRFFHNWRAEPWPSGHFQLPQWQVHRGLWADGLQENTLEAFQEARARGFKMVELDVQLARDGVPVVFHDDDLLRLAHRSDRVIDLTAEELRKTAKVPSLKDVLTDKNSVPYFNVEVKCRTIWDQKLARAVAEVVREAEAESKIIFSSFNPVTLWTLSRALPNVPRALLATDDTTDTDSAIYLRKLWLGGLCKAHMVNLDKKMINGELMSRLSERKIPVAAWTVNDADAAGLLLNKGVVSIISDKPVLS